MGKKIFSTLITFMIFFSLHAQLYIDAPYFAKQTIRVYTYHGLSMETSYNSSLDAGGKAVVGGLNPGFILLQFNEKVFFPMFYSEKENIFRFTSDGLPDFTACPQNSFFLRNLIKRQGITSKISLIDESVSKYPSDTELISALNLKKNELHQQLNAMQNLCTDSSSYSASFLLSALSLKESSYGIKTLQDLNQCKVAFLSFISRNYDRISSTDMIRQLGYQYMMMNEYVISGKENMDNQIIQDIRDWITLLKDHETDTSVVHFFTDYFRSRDMITMTGHIFETFPELSSCRSAAANGVAIKAESGKDAVYVIMDVDCPASVAAQVLLHRFLSEKNIPVNAVTVFCNRTPGVYDYRNLPDVRNQQFLPNGISAIGDSVISVKKYPAFVVADKTGKITGTYYQLDEVRKHLEESKTNR